MEHRPFGIDPHGESIRDVSGLTVKANVEYLEETEDDGETGSDSGHFPFYLGDNPAGDKDTNDGNFGKAIL